MVGGVRRYYNFDLFLEVRGKDEQFKVYKPGGICYVVSVRASFYLEESIVAILAQKVTK